MVPLLDLFSQGVATALGVFVGFLLVAITVGKLPSNYLEALQFAGLLVVLSVELEVLCLFARGRIYRFEAAPGIQTWAFSVSGLVVAFASGYALVRSLSAHAGST